MKLIKRMQYCIISIVLVIGILYGSVMKNVVKAESSGTCGNNVTWTLDDDGTLTISGSGRMENYDLVIHVPWYEYRSQLKIVQIEQGVESIGTHAFQDCALTDITIPDSVTDIEEYSFCGCTSLTSITIPDGVESIKFETFYRCTSLTSITIPESVTSINNRAFYECTSLTSITIPNSVTSIGMRAFENCSSLTSITIPDGVTTIRERLCYYCSSLMSVTIPDSVTTIEYGAFVGCKSLKSIIIPESVTSISSSVVPQTTKIYGYTGSYAETYANENKISFVPIDDVHVHNLVKTEAKAATETENGNIEYWTCSECGLIFRDEQATNQITLADTIIPKTGGGGTDPIEDEPKLVWELTSKKTLIVSVEGKGTIEMPDYSEDSPAPWAEELKSAKQIEVTDEGILSIGEYAFYAAGNKLLKVRIGKNVKEIRDYAFAGNGNLREVIFIGDYPSIGENAFRSESILTIGLVMVTKYRLIMVSKKMGQDGCEVMYSESGVTAIR